MKRYETAPKWDGRRWWPAVDVFDDRPGWRGKRTIKGDKSFETRDEALKASLMLLPPRARERAT
jgi:hypothetical protein